MVSNYFLKVDNKLKHIGKYSDGWYFLLHVYPEENIHGLSDWLFPFLTNDIIDDSGTCILPAKLLTIIRKPNNKTKVANYDKKIVSVGLCGLLRPKLTNNRVIGYCKTKPYAYVTGDFI